MDFYQELQQRIINTFLYGNMKRELVSKCNGQIHIIIENDKARPDGFDVLLIDGRADAGNGKEFLTIGKNLNEIEALELAVDFTKYCRLF